MFAKGKMSQPRSRSPLHSRNSGVPGRLTDGFYGEQYHSTVHSDQWRSSENSSKMEGSAHRDNTYVHGEQEVDHWAQFIEAIGRAGRQQHHTPADIQRYEEKPSNSPRRLPRERLPSPGTLRYGADPHQRIPSLLQHRSEHGVAFLGRHDSNRPNWDSKGSASGDSLGSKRDWIEHEYRNEAEEDRYQRSSFSERSQKSNYREQPPLPKRFRGLDPQEEHSASYRGFSPQKGLVIVEHDHGISKHPARSRDLQHGRDLLRTEHPRSRDPPRSSDLPWDRDHPRSTESQGGRDTYRRNDPSRSREPLRNRRIQDHHGGMTHDRQSGHIREEMRISHSTDGRNLVQGRSRPREQPRSEFSSRESHGHMAIDLSNQEDLRSDRNNRPRASGPAWEDETEHGRNHGIRPGQGPPRHRNNPVGGTERETLRIKVDMSRPVGHSRYGIAARVILGMVESSCLSSTYIIVLQLYYIGRFLIVLGGISSTCFLELDIYGS